MVTPVTVFVWVVFFTAVVGIISYGVVTEIAAPMREHVRNMRNIRKAEQSPEYKRYHEVIAKQQRAIEKYHTVNTYLNRMAKANTQEELTKVKGEADKFLDNWYCRGIA